MTVWTIVGLVGLAVLFLLIAREERRARRRHEELLGRYDRMADHDRDRGAW